VLPGSHSDDESHPEILENSPRWWARLWGPQSRPTVTLPLLNRVPRWLSIAVAVALLAGGGAVLVTSHTKHPPAITAPAAHVIFVPAACGVFINLSNSTLKPSDRVIFDDAVMPPAYLPDLLPPGQTGGSGSWRYGWKTGFGFRGGGLPVTISVPAAWRGRLALFGPPPPSSGFGTVTQLHLPSCPPKGVWNTFISSFFLHTSSACVPLDIQVGRQATTVWFGLGEHCPASRV
jgi:hypothetical protein